MNVVVGPLCDRQADTGINTRILSTHPAIPAEVSPPRAPEMIILIKNEAPVAETITAARTKGQK